MQDNRIFSLPVTANGVTSEVQAACRQRNQPSHIVGVDSWLIGLPFENSYRIHSFALASTPRFRSDHKILADFALHAHTLSVRGSDFDANLSRVNNDAAEATLFDQVIEDNSADNLSFFPPPQIGEDLRSEFF